MDKSQKVASARSQIAVTISYIITILLFPASLAGYLLRIGKALLTGRGAGRTPVRDSGSLFVKLFPKLKFL